MSLRSMIVGAIADAASDVAETLETVLHRRYVGSSGSGDPIFDPPANQTATPRDAIVIDYIATFHLPGGQEAESRHKVLFLGDVSVTQFDEITIQGEIDPATGLPIQITGPILHVGGVSDPLAGRYFTVVVLG